MVQLLSGPLFLGRVVVLDYCSETARCRETLYIDYIASSNTIMMTIKYSKNSITLCLFVCLVICLYLLYSCDLTYPVYSQFSFSILHTVCTSTSTSVHVCLLFMLCAQCSMLIDTCSL